MEKPDMNQFCDKCIKGALHSRVFPTSSSDILFDRVSKQINHLEKEKNSMNKSFHFRGVKPIVLVGLILILSVATCFAASKITSLVSMSTDSFDHFPTSQEVEKAVNYVPDYIESFSNGFHFKEASINQTEALDNDNNKVSDFKGITFHYTNDNEQKGQFLTLSTDPENSGTTGEIGPNEEVIRDGNLDLVYSKVQFKVVPEGYTPTEEEQQKMDQGILWISYGSDEIEITDIQYVKWVRGGIVYNLLDHGWNIDKDELVDMAKEVIGE